MEDDISINSDISSTSSEISDNLQKNKKIENNRTDIGRIDAMLTNLQKRVFSLELKCISPSWNLNPSTEKDEKKLTIHQKYKH